MAVDDRTLFEIYLEGDYNFGYRSIFYTDLEEHARDDEIARAAKGENVFSGYLVDDTKEEARKIVDAIIDELNELDGPDDEEERAKIVLGIGERLAKFLAADPRK